MISVPLLTSDGTSSRPVVLPTPIWSVPPGFRLIVPPAPFASLPVTDTSPPDIVSAPVPLEPTNRSVVLAQVPLSRFVRVPTRNAYTEWLQRVGSLSADLLLCDSASRVIAVVDIRSPQETERSRRRHERQARVLQAAGIRVYTWREGDLPTVAEVRSTLGAELGRQALLGQPRQSQPTPTNSRPVPLIPVAEIEEILADGDLAVSDAREPVPSSFFDDSEPAAAGARR